MLQCLLITSRWIGSLKKYVEENPEADRNCSEKHSWRWYVSCNGTLSQSEEFWKTRNQITSLETRNQCLGLVNLFDRFGEASHVSRLDLKTRFCQIWIQFADIEKKHLNRKYGQLEFFLVVMETCYDLATTQMLMNMLFWDHIYTFVYHISPNLLTFRESVV